MSDQNVRAALLFARWRPSYRHPHWGRAFGRLVKTGLSRTGHLTAHFQRPFEDVVDVYGTRPVHLGPGRARRLEIIKIASHPRIRRAH